MTKKILAFAAAFALLSAPARAEYPERPIQLVIPYGPGGATDLSARALAKPVGPLVGKPLLVVNRTGAGGATGSVSVANAEADGHTMLAARVGSHTVNPAMKATLPYTLDDFRFVGVYEINPVVCAVNSNSGIGSMRELVDKVRSSPGSVKYSSSGVGSLLHLAAVMVLDSFGVKDPLKAAVHLPMKGGGGAAKAVLSGASDFLCVNSSTVAGFVEAGQMTPLLVTTPKPLAGFDAPTAASLGRPELEKLVGWTGIAGPDGLPDEAANAWRGWLQAAVRDEEFLGVMQKRGSIVRLMSPEESVAFVNEQYRIFRELVDKLGMRIE